ncbi:hypothetical protein [Chitinibacter sp. S2-10]|uniref:pilus assembly PilX family protein n=1 Tax=Chitinibacter sp. S2-10 TaxID=3373597 RepID=UPI0039779793
MTISLHRQQGASTLLISAVLLIMITLGGLSISRQVIQESKASNQLFFRTKALEAANAGVAAFTAQLSDESINKTMLNGLSSTPSTITLNSKYADANLVYSLSAKTTTPDPVSGLPRLELTSTGCASNCSDGKAVVTQYISYEQLGGMLNDYLSINDTLTRIWGSSVTVDGAPPGSTGIGYGADAVNCNSPAPCTSDPYNTSMFFYTNDGAPGDKKAPAARGKKSSADYWKQIFGKTSRAAMKTKAESASPGNVVWINGDVEIKTGDRLLHPKDGSAPIDTANKIVIVDGNMTASALNQSAANDAVWGLVYVTKDVDIAGTGRINGMLAVEGNMRASGGSLHLYANPGSKGLQDPYKSLSFAGKSGWRDF